MPRRKKAPGTVTFVPYMPEKSPTTRKLQQTQLKRHVALRSNPKTREVHTFTWLNDESWLPKVDSEKNIDVISEGDIQRSKSWFFGAQGSAMNPISNFEYSIIQRYVEKGETLACEQHGTGPVPMIRPLLLPHYKDLLRLAMEDAAVMSSLVSATALLVAKELSDDQNLTAAALESSQRALQHLRRTLRSVERGVPQAILYAAIHLCKTALLIGDDEGARTHLNFVVQAVSCCEVESRPAHHRLNDKVYRSTYDIQCCRPAEICELHVGGIFTTKSAPVNEKGDILESKTSRKNDLQRIVPRSSFVEAVNAGILPRSILHKVRRYEHMLLCMVEVSQGAATIEPCGGNTAVRLVCDEWNNEHQGLDKMSPEGSSFNKVVNLAFVIHLGLSLGRYTTAQTRLWAGKMQRVLRDAHRETANFFKLQVTRNQNATLHAELLLWVAFVGMVAGGPEIRVWFRERVIDGMLGLNIETEEAFTLILKSCSCLEGPQANTFISNCREVVKLRRELTGNYRGKFAQ